MGILYHYVVSTELERSEQYDSLEEGSGEACPLLAPQTNLTQIN